jgi:hypothetical protein
MFDFVLLGVYQVSEYILFLYMFVSFYTILKQRVTFFWSSTPNNFSYEPPLLLTQMFVVVTVTILVMLAGDKHFGPVDICRT